MNMDLIMFGLTFATTIISVITAILNIITQTKINDFKSLRSQYLSEVSKYRKKYPLESISDESIYELLNIFLSFFTTMLLNGKNTDLHLTLYQYNKENNANNTILYLHYTNATSSFHIKKTDLNPKLSNMSYLYINDHNKLKEKFTVDVIDHNDNSMIFYSLKKQETKIGSILIQSDSKIIQKYSSDHICSLIEPIEDILTYFIDNSKHNTISKVMKRKNVNSIKNDNIDLTHNISKKSYNA